MLTFPMQDTHPLDSEMFHTKRSIISEHYGFTPALLDEELKDEKEPTNTDHHTDLDSPDCGDRIYT